MGKKVIRVGLLTPVRTLNPLESQDSQSTMASCQVYETPCRALTVEGEAQPLLFDRLTCDAPLLWKGHLRAGLTLSDGSPLAAAAVCAALSRCEMIREQATVRAVGDTLEFTLRAPNARFDLALTLHRCAVFVDGPGFPLGTGPFVPAPGTTLAALRLVRNPNSRERVAVDEVEFTVYPPDREGKATGLLQAITRGEVDFTNALSRSEMTSVSGMRKQFPPSRSTAILYFNCERPAFADPAVRRTAGAALDRLAIAKLASDNALAYVANGVLPPILGVSMPETARGAYPTPVRSGPVPSLQGKALRLLTVWAPRPYLPDPKAAAELIAAQLSALGPQIQIAVPASADEFYRTCARGDYDMFLGGWMADTPDAADFLEALLHSDRVTTERSAGLPHANRARFRKPELDALLLRFRSERGQTNVAALRDMLAADTPFVPLTYGAEAVATSWKLKGVELTALGHPLFGRATLGD